MKIQYYALVSASITACVCLVLTFVFTVLIPVCVDAVYERIHQRVAEEENAILQSARSVTEGIREVATNFDLAVAKELLTVDEIHYRDDKVVGTIRNGSDKDIYDVTVTVICKTENGALKDVISNKAKGFGMLTAGETGYFYVDTDDLEVAKSDRLEAVVVQAQQSFIYR